MQAAPKLCNIFLLLLIPLSGAEWTVTPGKDCSPGEGGEAIGEDSESTSISLSKCLAACEEDTTCVAVVRRAQDEAGPCYMRLANLSFKAVFDCVPKPQVQYQLDPMCGRQGAGGAYAEQR